METGEKLKEQDAEVDAIKVVFDALKGLEKAAQNRVLDYVMNRLELKKKPDPVAPLVEPVLTENETFSSSTEVEDAAADEATDEEEDGLEGINAVARKWMRRNDLTPAQLSNLFSLGIDDIDLVATSVPGGSIKERLRSVVLLKAIASYLSSGAARVDHNKVKEAAALSSGFR
jgi:hypothetical protein